MDSQTGAVLAEGSYILGSSNKLGDGYDAVNTHIKDTGFEVIPEYSNRNVIAYKKTEDPTHIHISHKGTSVKSKSGVKDLYSDMLIALGLGGFSNQAKKRKNKTELILKELEPKTFTMSSHSLGNYTQNYSIAKSKKVRDFLNIAHGYNGASTPLFNNDLEVSNKARKELSNRVIHHRTRGDIVSKGMKTSLPFGKLIEYKLRPTEHERTHKEIYNNVMNKADLKTKEELKKMNFTEKALYSHHLHHFSNRVLDPVKSFKKRKNAKK